MDTQDGVRSRGFEDADADADVDVDADADGVTIGVKV